MTNLPSDLPVVARPERKRATNVLPIPTHHGSLGHLLTFLALALAMPALAQVATEQQSAEGGEKEPAQAMVRAFVVPAEGTQESLELTLKPQNAEGDLAPQALATAKGAATFNSSYRKVNPGRVLVELRAGDKVLAQTSGVLRPARAYTFAAWQTSSAGWQMKAFSDDPTAPNVADRAVRVLNFPAGRETLLSIDEGSEIKVPANTVEEVRVPPKVVGASVKVLAPDGGPPALSTVEMDFTILKSGYIVVVPDNLGRMRPQFIGGGYEETPEVEAAPATAAAPVSPEAAKRQRITGAQMELDQQKIVLEMIKAREAAAGGNPSDTLRKNRLEAEKRIAELQKNLEAARSSTPPPGSAGPSELPR